MNNIINKYRHLRDQAINQIKEKEEPEKYFDQIDSFMEELFSSISELESQNKKLRETKELNKKLTVAVEQSPVTIVITDINGTIEYVNPTFQKTTGYTKEEAIGKNPSILKTSVTNPELHHELWDNITQGKTWQGQFVNKTKNGEEYIENSIIASIFNDNNEITHYIAIKEDVTEKVRIENQIKRSEKMFRIAFDNANIGIMNLSITGNIIYANKECTNIFGYSNDEFETMSVNDITVPEYMHISTNFINAALQDGKNEKAVFIKKYYHKTGKIISCEISSTLLFDADKKPLYFICHIKDITKQNKIEEALRKSEEKHRLINENASDVIWSLNLSTKKFTYISPSIYSLRGYTVQEALQQDLFQSFTLKSAKTLLESFQLQIKDRGKHQHKEDNKIYRYELRQPCKDGSVIWTETAASYHLNSKYEVEAICISRNIDGRKMYEKELEKLIATKDRFISILGHDLKNPFNSILGFSDLLLSDFNNLKRERIYKYVKLINQSSQETYNLLNNLLEWSRSQQKQIPFNPQYEYLDNIILETHQSLNNSAISKQIKIQIDTDEIIELEMDKEMIKTVLRNIVSNAIKFTPENGNICICSYKLSETVKIKISDTGIGMDEEFVQSLFQINKTKSIRGTNGEKGTGFGLLLCKELVEEHKGSIEVESEVGKGSTFIITLPIRQSKR